MKAPSLIGIVDTPDEYQEKNEQVTDYDDLLEYLDDMIMSDVLNLTCLICCICVI